MENTNLLNEEIESITISDSTGEIAKILSKTNEKGEIVTGKENISICIEYTGTDVKTIIHI